METTLIAQGQGSISSLDSQLYRHLEGFTASLQGMPCHAWGVLLGYRQPRQTLQQFANTLTLAQGVGRFRLVQLAGQVVQSMPCEQARLASVLKTLPRHEWLAAFPQVASCFPEPEAALQMLDLLSGRLVISESHGHIVRLLAW